MICFVQDYPVDGAAPALAGEPTIMANLHIKLIQCRKADSIKYNLEIDTSAIAFPIAISRGFGTLGTAMLDLTLGFLRWLLRRNRRLFWLLIFDLIHLDSHLNTRFYTHDSKAVQGYVGPITDHN